MKKLAFLSILAALTLMSAAVFLHGTAISNPYKNDKAGENYVALSFDDGPDPRFTPSVLQILEQYGVSATFFVVGSEAQKHLEILAMISGQGHELANHTWTHPRMAEISTGDLLAEVQSTNQLINGLTRGENRFFRPPRGQLSREQGRDLEEHRVVTRLKARGGCLRAPFFNYNGPSLRWAACLYHFTEFSPH